MAMEYKNKNGERFDISITHGDYMAHVNGNYVAKADTQDELEEILDHLSHADTRKTAQYLGLDTEKTAD